MGSWWRRGCALAVSLSICGLLAWPVAAQIQGAAQDGFVPVPQGQVGQEQLPATPLVFAAYAAVWVILIVYVFMLWRRLGGVEREIANLSRQIRGKTP